MKPSYHYHSIRPAPGADGRGQAHGDIRYDTYGYADGFGSPHIHRNGEGDGYGKGRSMSSATLPSAEAPEAMMVYYMQGHARE